MSGENPFEEGGANASKINALAEQIEAKTFETQDLLKARRMGQAKVKLKEVERLIKELASYNATIDSKFQEIIDAFKDVVEGRKTVEELFNVKIAKQDLPEKYVDDWKAHENAIIDFVNGKIRDRKYSNPEDVNAAAARIEDFVGELRKAAKEGKFPSWARVGLFSELYKAIKENFDGDLAPEMESAVGYVLDQALVFEDGDPGPAGHVEEPVKGEGSKIDPLFVYPDRLKDKFQLPEVPKENLLSDSGLVTGEDFLEGIEEDALPQDVLDDLNETFEELGKRVKTANPWQEALLNLFAVYVIKPVYRAIKENADVGLVRYPVRKILLKVRRTIGEIFTTPLASKELIGSVIGMIRISTAGLSDVGIKVFLDAKFDGAADMIFQMAKIMEESDVAENLTDILKRDPQEVAAARLRNNPKITRLSALTYLLFKLRDENQENKTLVIGIQFAIQVLIRLHHDDELLSISPVLRQNIKDLFGKNKAALTEVPFQDEVGDAEMEVVLKMIFPDALGSVAESHEKDEAGSLNYQKVEKFLFLVEDLLAKDSGQYSKYNAVLVCLMENIRQYMHDENAKDRMLKDFATLRDLIQKIAGTDESPDPFIKLVLDHPELIHGTVAAFYKESSESGESSGGRGQITRLKTILREISKENAGNKVVARGLLLVTLVLDSFSSDREFFAHIAQFEEVLDKVLFGKEFVGLRLGASARATLKSIIGYVPIERKEPDMAAVSRIADVFGNFDELAERPVAQLQERASVLMTEVPAVLKLNYALAGLGEGMKTLTGKMAGEKFGVKERALFDYLFANYRDYLCDKYDNDIEKFLLEVRDGDPPEIELKTENIEKEALVLAQFGVAALAKIGIPKVVAMIRSNLVSLAKAAKARLLKRKQAA